MPRINDDESIRVDRFLNAFNVVEAEIRKRTGVGPEVPFREASRTFVRQQGWWQAHEPAMSTFAEIRNFLVHTRTRPEFVAAVPHQDTVERIERIASSLAKPKLVIPTFRTDVSTFTPDHPLTDLLRVVHEREVTFFPIVDGEGFHGLVTGNGIMRWLAWLAGDDPLTDLSEIPVSSILDFEESRANYHFVPHDMPVPEALDHFRQHPELEAVLITHNGKATEALLGIITIWDVTNRAVD